MELKKSQFTQAGSADPSREIVPGSRTRAALAGLLTLVAGFGMLVLLDLTVQPVSDIPRIYSFISIMVGVAICLPLSIAGWHLARAQLPPSRAGRMAGVVAGLAGGIGMLYSQLVWLLDPNPESTWKMAEEGGFNTLGYYNLVFAVVFFVWGGYLFGDVQGRLFSARSAGWDLRKRALIRNRAGAVGLLAIIGYGLTVIADNISHMDQAASLAIVVNIVLLFVIVGLGLWLIRDDKFRPY